LPPPAECRVSAVLLAAGESLRMGARNKLTLSVNATPLLRHTVQVLLASRLQEIVVVLGHDAQAMAALLEDLPVTLVENPAYRQGQMGSVHAGLAALEGARDGVMICLTDQPLIMPGDIDSLIDAFARRSLGSILVPTHGGVRGNPIVLADAHRREILEGGRNLGCRRLIERNPTLVETVEMADDHVLVDLDTPEDYRNLMRRLAPTSCPRQGAA
jgi:molybdenum cofactor cytidylyltransferase